LRTESASIVLVQDVCMLKHRLEWDK